MTHSKFRKELNILGEALQSETGEKKIREYLSSYVKNTVDEYVKEQKIIDIPKDELTNAGWKYFHMAIKRYVSRAHLMLEHKNDIFYFETYFRWFIRQGVAEYVYHQRKDKI